MKKEEVFVKIDSEEKRLRAIQILTDGSEEIWKNSRIFEKRSAGNLILGYDCKWKISRGTYGLTEITIDHLEQLLTPNYTVKEVHLTVDELREQAEKLGFELVEKKREVKIGDFGLFWDDEDPEMGCYSFLAQKKDIGFKDNYHTSTWENFRHLTDEEKQKIKENW